MMPQDVLQKLRRRPFQPFRLFLSDGTSYEIHHPEMAIVGQSAVVIGIPGPKGSEGPAERIVDCSIFHITRLEPIDGAPATQQK